MVNIAGLYCSNWKIVPSLKCFVFSLMHRCLLILVENKLTQPGELFFTDKLGPNTPLFIALWIMSRLVPPFPFSPIPIWS
jgi:hypothetical protein